MTKVLVTGGAGFIGSHVVTELVRRGYEVVVLDNLSNSSLNNLSEVIDRVVFVEGDVRDSKLISNVLVGVDAVIHLAALIDVSESIEKPLLYHEVNTYGTHVLLDACVRKGVKPRIIYASSSAVYGEPRKIPISEDDEVRPTNPYGLSKLLAEELIKYYSRTYGLKATIFRIFNAYGPKQWWSKYAGVITKFIKQVSRGEPPTIYGSGEQVRDFIYVEDVAKVFVEALEKDVDGVYNLGTGRGTKVKELAEAILRIYGIKNIKPTHTAPRPGDIEKSVADVTKLKKAFNVEFTSIEEGLKKTIEDYMKNVKGRVWLNA